jgi:hypothetical protein
VSIQLAEVNVTAGIKLEERLGVPVEELMDALSDEAKARELLDKHGWTQADLIERSEELTRSLTSEISTLNMV